MKKYSEYQSVGEWYEDLKREGYSVPLQLCHALSQLMKKDGSTFEEAYKILQEQNRIFIEGNMFIFDLSEKKAIPKRPYRLVKIDLLDTYIYADIFEDEAYTILEESENLEHLLDMAIGGFLAENPKYTTYKDWQEEAENGGYEFEIFDEGPSSIFRGSMMLLHPIVFNALNLARKYHYGQMRKGDDKQYIIHILEISRLLFGHGGSGVDPEIIAASICHDLLEDTDCTEVEIEQLCGAEVVRTVKAVTNDSSLEWEAKKSKYIETAREGGEKAMIVCLADKIVNLKALLKIYKQEGEKVWTRFNRGKDKKLWFEKAVLHMLKENLGHSLIKRYEDLISEFEQK